ncbi:vinculin-like [Haliotis asinina]|uniref:vinculin-like n=1 Tax=Haliotis asinina TaxID=109174 RepID=UPI0035320AE9
MDVTYGLISNLVKTKSVERVLAPIASQVSLLIILTEGSDAHQDGRETPGDISTCAKCVSAAVESFIGVAKQQAHNAKQAKFQQDMASACETLDLAQSGFYVAAQKLTADSSNRQTRVTLVQRSKEVLQGILKVLLVSDNAEVDRMVAAVGETKIKVRLVGQVSSVKELVAAFKSLTESVMALIVMMKGRQKELINSMHREQLITSMTVLRKSLTGLNTAVQTYLKYPGNPEAQTGKEVMIGQILSTLSDIQEALESKQTRETTLNIEEPGYFITRVDFILESLAEESREVIHPDFETWMAGIVRHSMAVAHLCTDDYRDVIIQSCQRVLQLKGRILELTVSLKQSLPDSHHRREQGDVCETMLDEVCHLEQHVNMALLHLMVDVFKETTEPLEKLLKAVLCPKQNSVNASVNSLVADFSNHADSIYQVASLAAASSSDSKRVRAIRASVYYLERVDPDIVPSIKAVARQPANMAALRNLKLLVKGWKEELSVLVEVLDEIVDPELFIEVSELKISEDISAVRGFLLEADKDGSTEAISCVFHRTSRVIQIAQSVVDHNTDAIYRNGLLVFVRKLQQAESITKEAQRYLLRDFHNQSLQATFLKHLHLLKGFVRQVKEGLSAENHPDISSPERMDVYHKKRLRLNGSKINKPPSKRHSHSHQLSSYRPRSESSKDHTSRSSNQTQASKPAKRISPGRQQKPVFSVDETLASGSLGVKMSDIRLVAKQFVSAAVAGDKQRVNALTSDLLGWTNHILDAAQGLTNHCTELEHKKEIESLCEELDQLAPQTINKAKFVVAGDISEVANLQHTADTWANKLDKVRVHLDVAVDTWKSVADGIMVAIQRGNVEKLKAEIAILESHQEALGSLLSSVESFTTSITPETEATLTFLRDQRDDLENLTITMKTTADLTLQTGDATDVRLYRSQLGQLCREWAVLVTCILSSLHKLTSQVMVQGCDKIAGLGEVTPDNADTDNMRAVGESVKELLDSVSVGDEDLKSQSFQICEFLDSSVEELQTPGGSAGKFKDIQESAIYCSQHHRLVLALWVAKVLEAQQLVNDLTADFRHPLETFHAQALDIHRLSLTDPTSSAEHSSNYLCEVSKMAANISMVQQKTLNAIQLSPDLAKRGVVRRCLDDIAALTPQVLDKLKSYVEDSSTDDTEQETIMVQWAARMKKLTLTLQQMPDLRPTLNTEIVKLLTMEPSRNSLPKNISKEVNKPKLKYREDIEDQLDTQGGPQTPLKTQGNRGHNSVIETPMHGRSIQDTPLLGTPNHKPLRSIMSSAIYLEEVTNQWNSENQVILVAMEMVKHTKNIADFCLGRGELEDTAGLVRAASSVVENGRTMQRFIQALADSCVEESDAQDLRVCVDKISSFTTQLNIICGVLHNSPTTAESDKIVLRNTSNLLKAVQEAFLAAEKGGVRGLTDKLGQDSDDKDILALVTKWQKALVLQRSTEASTAPRDELGLRRVEQHQPPSLVHFLQ